MGILGRALGSAPKSALGNHGVLPRVLKKIGGAPGSAPDKAPQCSWALSGAPRFRGAPSGALPRALLVSGRTHSPKWFTALWLKTQGAILRPFEGEKHCSNCMHTAAELVHKKVAVWLRWWCITERFLRLILRRRLWGLTGSHLRVGSDTSRCQGRAGS